VGRETALQRLHEWFERAQRGLRQIVFVTGDLGMGKTTLVEAFLTHITRQASPWLTRGQCIAHYGTGEAYMPALEALTRLCREPGGERLLELLSQQAPTWMAQMPALLNTGELEALQREVQGATRERMLREMADAVEVLTADKPLVSVLEDLHLSD
jgi:predicted ATPase